MTTFRASQRWGGGAFASILVAVLLTLPWMTQAQLSYETNTGTINITGGCPDSAGSVTIPETINGLPVTRIGGYAFSGCTSLTNIIIPKSIISILPSAFSGCTSLTGVLIPNGVVNIYDGAFARCTSLTSIALPNSVIKVRDSAFSGCTGLTNVILGRNVDYTVTTAFFGCTSLVSIEADPANLTFSSKDGVLYNKNQTVLMLCPGGKTGAFNIPNSVTSIGSAAFAECTSLTSITIPNSVTNIGSAAFVGCTNLGNVAINAGVSNIDRSAFSGCTSLTNVTFSNNLTRIGESMFAGCTSLTRITLPSSLTTIGYSAFINCASLTNVTIPASVTSIGELVFGSCANLVAIEADPDNPYFSSEDGILYDKARTALVLCPGGKTPTISIPDSVTDIRNAAFYTCTGLVSITIPNNVTNLGRSAFSSCPNLTSITLPNSLRNVSDYAFSYCRLLASITIPNGVTNIGNGAFFGCTGLTSIAIPNSVPRLAHLTFNGCTSLTSITIPASVTNLGSAVFSSCSSLKGAFFQGNAPALEGGPVFESSGNVAVYYLPGTLGWGPTFAGRPTIPWTNPIVSAGSAGLNGNSFAFSISWAPSATLIVEACAGLEDQMWFPISTNNLSSGTWYFSDPSGTSYPARFYRVRSP